MIHCLDVDVMLQNTYEKHERAYTFFCGVWIIRKLFSGRDAEVSLVVNIFTKIVDTQNTLSHDKFIDNYSMM